MPSSKPPRRHPTISLAEFSAIHDLGEESELDRVITLKQACERVFYNAISVATLKAEHARGNLDVSKVGRKYFTTSRKLTAMMEKCRLPAKSGIRVGSTDGRAEAAHLHATQVALRLQAEGRTKRRASRAS